MADARDWIEQDEFDWRKAQFESRFVPRTVAPGSTAAAQNTPEKEALQSDEGFIAVTVRNMSGEVVFGPESLGEGHTIGAIVGQLASALAAPPGVLQLLANERLLGLAETLGTAASIADRGVEFTMVRRDDIPAGAVTVSDLAVWKNEGSATKGGTLLKGRKRPDDKFEVVGRSLETGEVFLCTSSLGRCNNITLRFGRGGVYYNSSSHGTVTLLLQTFAADAPTLRLYDNDGGSSDEDDDDDDLESLTVIEGCHSRLPKGPDAAARMLDFVSRLSAAAGKQLPVIARSWFDVLTSLQVEQSTAVILTVCALPWLDNVVRMNEGFVWEWSQTEFSDDESRLSEQCRTLLTSMRHA